jgi:predicted PurR-regulated permease PerM
MAVPNQSGVQAAGAPHRFAAARTVGKALRQWWRAAMLESLSVGLLWWVGLVLIHVPLAPLWALLAALAAFIPHIGGAISLVGPVLAVALSGGDFSRLGLVLGLYAGIVILDQLLIEPLLMRQTTRVPLWASILSPIVLGVLIPFWGVLLAPPLLAVVYAFRRPKRVA